MIEFLKRLFGTQGSSVAAKERLRLVLMTDHLELAPEMIEAMKRDLVDVISRHVEVDRDRIEVNFERQDSALAMLANIPIISVNRPSNGTNGTHNGEAAANGTHAAEAVTNGAAAPPSEPPAAEAVKPEGAPRARKRRKRAKKAAPTNGIAPPEPAAQGAGA